MRFIEGPRAAVAQQNARIYAAWEAEQRAARGLRPDQSLDARDGVPLPLSEAITNADNGYCMVIESADRTIAALPLDDHALALQGRGGVDVRGHKDESELDERLRERVRPRPRPLGGARGPR